MSERRAKQPHKTAELRHNEDAPEPYQSSPEDAPASEPGSAPGPVLDGPRVPEDARDVPAKPRPLFLRSCAALPLDPDQVRVYRDNGDAVQIETQGGQVVTLHKDRLPE